jgi:hypothetical protein
MSAFSEFCLVALALYAWESIFWFPLSGVCLRIGFRKKKIRVSEPDRWFVTKSAGLIFTSFLPGSRTFFPCQPLPLVVDDTGRWLILLDNGRYVKIPAPSWDDISELQHQLRVGNRTVKVSSSRCLQQLWQGKKRGLSPGDAVRDCWRKSLSLSRVSHEWKKWQLLAAPLFLLQPLLMCWFIYGAVLYAYQGEHFRFLYFLVCMLLIMLTIATRVIWMGRKGYPVCGSSFTMDALLACLVPFHSMRVAESCAQQALSGINPIAALLEMAPSNTWLWQQLRQLSHPRSHRAEDEILYAALAPFLEKAFSQKKMHWSDFDQAPDQAREEGETSYCPRCHALYLAGKVVCGDCLDYPLRNL